MKTSNQIMTLSQLKVNDNFRLKNNRFYLKNHTYKVVEITETEVIYALAGNDKYNQKTRESKKGAENTKVILA